MNGRKSGGTGREALGIGSVEIAARILRAMVEGGGAMPLRDIAAACGMHRGKVHRYLVSLARAGLASREGEGRYSIGPLAISAGLAGLNRLDPVRMAYDALPGLRDRIGETVVLAIWGERGPTVIALEDSARPVTLNVRVGSILPVRSSAIGRAFAAFLPESALGAESTTPAMKRVLAAVRRRGVAEITGTLIPGLNALAAPVFDAGGRPALVIGVVGRRETLGARRVALVSRELSAAAADLSSRLGYPGRHEVKAATPAAASEPKRR